MSNIKPFIKWAGGKEKELPIILKNLPSSFDRYIEPFVGGGAVYLNINCKNSIINDKSDELMLLYKMIKKGDKDFIKSLNDINKNWIALENIVLNSSTELIELYNSYKKDISQLEKLVDDYISNHNQELNALLREDVDINLYNLISEIKKNMISKISRMYKLEQKSGDLSKEDTIDNLECSFKSAYYMYFRYLYNNKNKLKLSNSFYCAVFYFVRDYCYASMFRYNANGELNVKYPEGKELQKRLLEEEGHTIISKGTKNIKYYVKDFENSLIEL